MLNANGLRIPATKQTRKEGSQINVGERAREGAEETLGEKCAAATFFDRRLTIVADLADRWAFPFVVRRQRRRRECGRIEQHSSVVSFATQTKLGRRWPSRRCNRAPSN